jgi:LysM repeat protein
MSRPWPGVIKSLAYAVNQGDNSARILLSQFAKRRRKPGIPKPRVAVNKPVFDPRDLKHPDWLHVHRNGAEKYSAVIGMTLLSAVMSKSAELEYNRPALMSSIAAAETGHLPRNKTQIFTQQTRHGVPSYAWGPHQITGATAADVWKRNNAGYTAERRAVLEPYVKLFQQQVDRAAKGEPGYGPGEPGFLGSPEYDEGYRQLVLAVLEDKIKTNGKDPIRLIQAWRGDNGDHRYHRLAAHNYLETIGAKDRPDWIRLTPGHHLVRPKETLGAIAAQHGISINQLMELNGITNPNKVIRGDVLKLAPGVADLPEYKPRNTIADYVAGKTYTIAPGDSFSRIEARNHWPQGLLTRLNPGVNPLTLQPGQNIATP